MRKGSQLYQKKKKTSLNPSSNIDQSVLDYDKVWKTAKMLLSRVTGETLLPKEASRIFSAELLHTIRERKPNSVL